MCRFPLCMCKHQRRLCLLLFPHRLCKLPSSTNYNGFLRIPPLRSWSRLYCIFPGNLDSRPQCHCNIQSPHHTDIVSMGNYCSHNCKFVLNAKKTLILLIKVKESLVINTLVFWCGHTLNNISSDPEMWKFSLSNRRVGTHLDLALCLSFSSFSFSSFFHKSVVAKIWEMVPNLRNWFH